jgi:hypothetical protein
MYQQSRHLVNNSSRQLDDSQSMEIEHLQQLARDGQLRWRAFGEERIYGSDRRFGGNLKVAAASLPSVIETGMVRVYKDALGFFIGPINPRYIAECMDLSDEGVGDV